jgi:hypothetical protein
MDTKSFLLFAKYGVESRVRATCQISLRAEDLETGSSPPRVLANY